MPPVRKIAPDCSASTMKAPMAAIVSGVGGTRSVSASSFESIRYFISVSFGPGPPVGLDRS